MHGSGRGRGRHAAADEIREKLGRFAGRPRFNEEFEEAFEFFFGESVEHLQDTLDESDFERFMEWFVYDYRLANGHRLIEIFDLEHGADLSRAARRLLRGWEQANLTLLELVERREDRCVLTDLLTGKRYETTSESVAPGAARWSLIVARPLSLGSTWELPPAQTVVAPGAKEAFVALLRGEYRRHRRAYGDVPVSRFLRDQGFLFNDLLDEVSVDEPISYFEGDDAHRIVRSRALFAVRDGVKAIERLLAYSDVEAVRPGRLVWYDDGSRERGGAPGAAPRRALAEIQVSGGRLQLYCWTRHALEECKRRLAERLRGLALHLVDAFEEPRCRPGDAEAAAWAKAAYDDYLESWLTQPLPALDGFTPQELKDKPLGRIRLAELLKKLEHHQASREGRGLLTAGELRRRLGIDESVGLVIPLDQQPTVWNSAAEERVAEGIRRSFQRLGLADEYIDSALWIWWDYCYRRYPRVRKPEAWVAAVHAAVSFVESWGVAREKVAALYGVSPGTVSQNVRRIIDCLELDPFDDRYCVEHPVDGLLDRLGRMQVDTPQELEDPVTVHLALVGRARDALQAACARHEGLQDRAEELFFAHVGRTQLGMLCRECFIDWYHFDWRVPVMGGRTLLEAALAEGAVGGELKEVLERWVGCHPSFYAVEGVLPRAGDLERTSPRLTLRELVTGKTVQVDWMRLGRPLGLRDVVFARLVPVGELVVSLGPVLIFDADRRKALERAIAEDRALIDRWNEARIDWDEFRARYAERLYALALRAADELGAVDEP